MDDIMNVIYNTSAHTHTMSTIVLLTVPCIVMYCLLSILMFLHPHPHICRHRTIMCATTGGALGAPFMRQMNEWVAVTSAEEPPPLLAPPLPR